MNPDTILYSAINCGGALNQLGKELPRDVFKAGDIEDFVADIKTHCTTDAATAASIAG